MCNAMILQRIEATELNAAVYRTARRLLDLCNPQTGAARVTHEEMRHLAGTNADGTARNHLHQLQAAGILTYRRDGDVRIWFADWLPGNIDNHDDQPSTPVHSGARTAGNLHSGARVARDSEHSSVHSGARVECNLHAPRAICTPDVHPPHTGASARSGWLVGINQSPEIDNQPTNPPEAKTELQPWEPELSYRLLTDKRVAMRPDFARKFSQQYPFHHIRDAVAHWRDGAGENFKRQPGIVVAWLKDPGSIVIPVASAEFLRSELAQAYRTPHELAADLEPPPEPPPIVASVQAQPPPASGYLDDDPGWEVMVSDPHLKGKLAGLVRIDSIDGVPCYVYAAKDALQVQWLNNRCATSLRKSVAAWVGHPVLVEFIAGEDDENQDPR